MKANVVTNHSKADFNQFLRELITHRLVRGLAADVTEFVISHGMENLTPLQGEIFDLQVLRIYVNEKCEQCGGKIPWSEMFPAIDSGMCTSCRHQIHAPRKSE